MSWADTTGWNDHSTSREREERENDSSPTISVLCCVLIGKESRDSNEIAAKGPVGSIR